MMARITLILSVLTALVALLGGFQWLLGELRAWSYRRKQTGKWLVIASLCLMPELAEAACSGTSPNLTAASAAQAEVAACVTAAVSGDTITVPSGAASWSSGGVDLNVSKDLTIVGAGTVTCSGTPGTSSYSCSMSGTTTTITCTDACLTIPLNQNIELTGFTFQSSGNGFWLFEMGSDAAADKHFNIHHNRLRSTSSGWAPIKLGSNNYANVHPSGIWHHNITENVALHTNGTLNSFSDGNNQHAIWAADPGLGNSTQVVYLEDNYMVSSSDPSTFNGNFTDGNYGGRVVIRFNRTQGGYSKAFEFHSPQGANRGFQRWELYNNAVVDIDDGDGCFHGIASIRGGTGVMFNNAASGQTTGCNYDLILDNVRSNWEAADEQDGVTRCNGSSTWDENTTGEQGWHCRDQIGTAYDVSQWNHTTTPAWNQVLRPIYLFSNTIGGSRTTAYVDDNVTGRSSIHIVSNRDYYEEGASFDGTTGVGIGTIGVRPASCTTGVAYWATDEGEWNSRNGATADGRLYKCTATNTWTLYYTPYTYPHPWTGEEGGGESSPASVLYASMPAARWLEWAGLVVGLGWHARRVIVAGLLVALPLGASAWRGALEGTRWTVALLNEKAANGAGALAEKYVAWRKRDTWPS